MKSVLTPLSSSTCAGAWSRNVGFFRRVLSSQIKHAGVVAVCLRVFTFDVGVITCLPW